MLVDFGLQLLAILSSFCVSFRHAHGSGSTLNIPIFVLRGSLQSAPHFYRRDFVPTVGCLELKQSLCGSCGK
jgi:hypothetical protein